LLKHLEPDQATFARAAFDALTPEREKLAKRLKLPIRTLWAESPDLSEILQPLPDAELNNSGRPVYRTTRARKALYGLLGLITGVVAAILVLLVWDTGSVLMLPFIGLAGGLFVGTT